MIWRLYDEETSTHFRMEWFLMAYTLTKIKKAFNWASILSFIITNIVQDPQGIKNHGFYMTTFLIDAIFISNRFLAFNWAWIPNTREIHVYCSQLWELNCKENFYNLSDYFLAPLHKAMFGVHPHRISLGAIKSLKGIGDYYIKNSIPL